MARFFDWERDARDACDLVESRKGIFKIVLKTCDEDYHLKRWLDHHERICGLENIIIFDHGSTDEGCLDVLAKVSSAATVIRYSGHLDSVHHNIKGLAGYDRFYDALRKSCDYFCFLDTDERLEWITGERTLSPLSEVSEQLTKADVGETGVLAGVWLNCLLGAAHHYRCFSGDSKWPAGILGGKPVISTRTRLPRTIWHNMLLNLECPENVLCGNILILHNKYEDVMGRLRANLKKIQTFGGLAHQSDWRESLAEFNGVNFEVDFPPNIRGWAAEVRQILDLQKNNGLMPDLAPGCVYFDENREMKFYSDAEGARFDAFLRNPGRALADALG